jgi:hypothetical protein
MKRDVVALMREVNPPSLWRAKIPIPAAPKRTGSSSKLVDEEFG